MRAFTHKIPVDSLKAAILNFREQGWSYNAISKELGCSKATISYHCNASVKASNKRRMRLDRSKRGQRKLNKNLLGNILSRLIQYKKV